MSDLSVATAEKIIKENSKTFYFASKFLNKEKKEAIWLLYAFCRLTDNLVDTGDLNLTQKNKNLDNWKKDFKKEKPKDLVLRSFKQRVIENFFVPVEYAESIIEGCREDLKKSFYKNFSELGIYSYQVASCVGIISLYILGFNRKKEKIVLEHAIKAGVALQLTNIIRDVIEDLKIHQRIYLPEEDFQRFSYTKKELEEQNFNQNFEKLIMLQIFRAKELYKKSQLGFKFINLDGRFAIVAALRIYEEILNKILQEGPLVITQKRVTVSMLKKIFLIPEIIYLALFSLKSS